MPLPVWTSRIVFTTSGTYGTGLVVSYSGIVIDTVMADGVHTYDVPAYVDNDTLIFSTDEDEVGFYGTVSDISIKQVLYASASGSVSFSEKIKNYHTLLNNGAGVMKFKEDKNGWTSFARFSPERMVSINNFLYSFKEGRVYKHDETNLSFFGTSYDSIISFRVQGGDGVIKILDYISVESNVKPKYTHVSATNPYTQATDLCEIDFVYDEGNFYASFLMDKLSPDFTNPSEAVNYAEALLNGDPMRAKWFDIFMIFDNSKSKDGSGYVQGDFFLSAVNVGMTISKGHKK